MPDKININIDATGLHEKIKTLEKRVDNTAPVFAQIAEVMKSSVDKNFMVQGRYSEPDSWMGGSSKWEPLSVWTMFNKIGGKKGFKKSGSLRAKAKRTIASNQILQQSGQLASSIQPFSSNGIAEVSTNKIYAAIHNFGGMAGRGKKIKIPARPFMVLQAEDIQDSISLIESYLTRGMHD